MKQLTQDQINQLVEIVYRMRVVAGPVGPMHSWWDSIFDCEYVLAGQEPSVQVYKEDVNKLITDCLFCLAEHDWQKANQIAEYRNVIYTKPQPGLDLVANKVIS